VRSATGSAAAGVQEVAILSNVPDTLYQTLLTPDGRQDSSTPHEIVFLLPPALQAAFAAAVTARNGGGAGNSGGGRTGPPRRGGAASAESQVVGADVGEWVSGTIRLFTGEEIRVRAGKHSMHGSFGVRVRKFRDSVVQRSLSHDPALY
jgi:hypothetical protein